MSGEFDVSAIQRRRERRQTSVASWLHDLPAMMVGLRASGKPQLDGDVVEPVSTLAPPSIERRLRYEGSRPCAGMAGACAGRPTLGRGSGAAGRGDNGHGEGGKFRQRWANPTNGADQNDRPPDEVAVGLAAVEEASGDVTGNWRRSESGLRVPDTDAPRCRRAPAMMDPM